MAGVIPRRRLDFAGQSVFALAFVGGDDNAGLCEGP